MARPQTPNRGAADIIAQVIAKIKRMQTARVIDHSTVDGDRLIKWLQEWDARAAKKAGGLGRK